MRDSAAAKDLLYRRVRALADYENANKNLEKARTKNKDVPTVCETVNKFSLFYFISNSNLRINLFCFISSQIQTCKHFLRSAGCVLL